MTLGRSWSVPLRSERRGPLRSPACYCSAAAGTKVPSQRRRRRSRSCSCRGPSSGAAAAAGDDHDCTFSMAAANERAVPRRVWCKVRRTGGPRDGGKDYRLQKGGEGNGGTGCQHCSTFCPYLRPTNDIRKEELCMPNSSLPGQGCKRFNECSMLAALLNHVDEERQSRRSSLVGKMPSTYLTASLSL